ncbi:hypothetical protein JCM5350_002561 [Sporobolomyces pararoseus]
MIHDDKGRRVTSASKRSEKVESANSIQAPSLVSLPPPRKRSKSVVHDPRSQSLFRCFDWMVNSTFSPPPRQTVAKLSFPISYLRTRISGAETEEQEESHHSSILPPSLSSTCTTTPPLLSSSGSSSPSSLSRSVNAVFDAKPSSSCYPTERRSSVESNFSTVSTLSSSSSSSSRRTRPLSDSRVVERQWWKIDSVSVMNEKKPEEDQSDWKVIAW